MLTEIIETHMNCRREVIGTEPTFAAAKSRVEAMGVAFMENDAEYPGCADAFLTDGRLVAIQPVGFKIAV